MKKTSRTRKLMKSVVLSLALAAVVSETFSFMKKEKRK